MHERLEAFREEAEALTELPAFREIAQRGRARRRRHQAVTGAVAASILAATGFLAAPGGDPGDPQPAEDSEPSSAATPYPRDAMVTLEAGTYEITTSPDGLRPAVRFTLPAGWNAEVLPTRFAGLDDRVTYDAEVNEQLLETDPDWYVGMHVLDVQWVAQRRCSDVTVTDAESLVQALTNVPGLEVTAPPESTTRFGHPAVHLRLRDLGREPGRCRRTSVLGSASYGYFTHNERGATFDAWVVDVVDRPVLVGASWTRRTPRAEVDALLRVLDSIELLAPEGS